MSELVINNQNTVKLSSTVKDCAKQIIDAIYDVDGFARIQHLFINGLNIKINADEFFPIKNSLSYLFARPDSSMYNPRVEARERVFRDKEYVIKVDGQTYNCRLSTQWKDAERGARGDGNYVGAVIAIMNHFYSDELAITEKDGNRYLSFAPKDFKYAKLPEVFQNDFARRYITSLLAKPFVILTGNSGTGKTRISKQFSEYLEHKDTAGKKNWLIVPVGADWTDNTKILGFYNPLGNEGQGKYEETSVFALIKRANENKDIPYFLVLDEMNLSHVERYFSDFLSHMETPDSAFEIDGAGTIPFPENLFVIGTVNIDETTYMFSPKVLDRANVVEFKPERESVMQLFFSSDNIGKIHAANDGSDIAFLKLAREIRGGKCDLSEEDLEKMRGIFDSVYTVLEEKGFEFAYRTVREIRQYICAAYELQENFEAEQLTEAIDEQLLQKVLPKIHGNKKEIGEMLTKLAKICEEKQLQKSLGKINQMKGRLETVQYASFI